MPRARFGLTSIAGPTVTETDIGRWIRLASVRVFLELLDRLQQAFVGWIGANVFRCVVAQLLGEVHVGQLIPAAIAFVLADLTRDHVTNNRSAELLHPGNDVRFGSPGKPLGFQRNEDLVDQSVQPCGDVPLLWLAEILDLFEPKQGLPNPVDPGHTVGLASRTPRQTLFNGVERFMKSGVNVAFEVVADRDRVNDRLSRWRLGSPFLCRRACDEGDAIHQCHQTIVRSRDHTLRKDHQWPLRLGQDIRTRLQRLAVQSLAIHAEAPIRRKMNC